MSVEVLRSLEQTEKAIQVLITRNKTLAKLVHLFYSFNHPQWLLKVQKLKNSGNPLKKKYPIEEIMNQIRCSKRTAYDYAMALDALSCCLTFGNSSLFLLVCANIEANER